LFTHELKKNGIAIINDNIKGAQTLKNKLIKKNQVISYGKKNSDVNIIYIKNKIEIKIFSKKYLISLLNYSPIELENIACAICCCLSLNIYIKDIIKVLPKIIKPKGRLEEVGKLKNNSIIYVDYAHTPDALKNVLISKTFLKSKPNVVFGCGGERDEGKRLLMGSIANRYASKVYITDDNPRNENPKKIRKAILSKCKRAIEIPDRKKAIEEAINDLQKNEILIIAGKGHEKNQVRKNQIRFFDDVQVAKYFIMKKI
jgi:UDP-N-acetylmuramyl tripeptide synthase